MTRPVNWIGTNAGVPPVSDFSNTGGQGTPIVINNATNVPYYLLNGVVTPLSAIAAVATPPSWNKIVNGKCQFAQLGTTFASTSTPTNTTTLDKWVTTWSNGTTLAFTISQDTDAPSGGEFSNCLAVTCDVNDTFSAAEYMTVNNTIEGYNIPDIVGRTFTLGFWVKSPVTGQYAVRMTNVGGANIDRTYIGTYTVNAASTWEFKSITVTGGLPTGGTWNYTSGIGLAVSFVLAAGTDYHDTGDTWLTTGAQAKLSTSSQVNFFASNGNVFRVTGVQINLGSTASAFQHSSYEQEFARVQRYCYIFTGGAMGYADTSTVVSAHIRFPVPMRAAPTLLATGGASLQSIDANSVGTGVNPSSISVTHLYNKFDAAVLNFGNYTGLTPGEAVLLQPQVYTARFLAAI